MLKGLWRRMFDGVPLPGVARTALTHAVSIHVREVVC